MTTVTYTPNNFEEVFATVLNAKKLKLKGFTKAGGATNKCDYHCLYVFIFECVWLYVCSSVFLRFNYL